MNIVKLYSTSISNPYMVAEFDDGSFRSIRLDPSCSFFIAGLPIEKMGVHKSTLYPISNGEMRMVYQQHVDDYNREHGGREVTPQ